MHYGELWIGAAWPQNTTEDITASDREKLFQELAREQHKNHIAAAVYRAMVHLHLDSGLDFSSQKRCGKT